MMIRGLSVGRRCLVCVAGGRVGGLAICRPGTVFGRRRVTCSRCIRACSFVQVATRACTNTELAYPHVAVLIAHVCTDMLAYDGSVTMRTGRVVPSCISQHAWTGFLRACLRRTSGVALANLPAFSSNRISHLQPGCRVAYAIAFSPLHWVLPLLRAERPGSWILTPP